MAPFDWVGLGVMMMLVVNVVYFGLRKVPDPYELELEPQRHRSPRR